LIFKYTTWKRCKSCYSPSIFWSVAQSCS